MALNSKYLRQLQRELQESNASWEAEENQFTDIPMEQWPLYTGHVPADHVPKGAEKEAIATDNYAAHLADDSVKLYPKSHTWLNYNGNRYTSNVKNQKQCGSCVAFATAATLETQARIYQFLPFELSYTFLFNKLSPTQIYFCSSSTRTCSGNNAGMSLYAGMNYCKNTGVVPAYEFPYTDHDQRCKLPGDWKNKLTKIQGYTTLRTLKAMKEWLHKKGPLLTSFNVYPSFHHYKKGIYKKHPGEVSRSSHAVCCVGYDDDKQAWLMQNSWGANWGQEGGFFWIGYGQCGIDERMLGVDDFVDIYYAKEGGMLGVGTDGLSYTRASNDASWKTYKGSPSSTISLIDMDVKLDGSLIGLDQNGKLYHRVDWTTNWQAIEVTPSTPAFISIAVTPTGKVLAVSSDHQLYSSYFTLHSWNKINTSLKLKSISTSVEGLLIGVGYEDGKVYTRKKIDKTTWNDTPIYGVETCAQLRDDSIVATMSNGTIKHWKSWDVEGTLLSSTKKIKSIKSVAPPLQIKIEFGDLGDTSYAPYVNRGLQLQTLGYDIGKERMDVYRFIPTNQLGVGRVAAQFQGATASPANLALIYGNQVKFSRPATKLLKDLPLLKVVAGFDDTPPIPAAKPPTASEVFVLVLYTSEDGDELKIMANTHVPVYGGIPSCENKYTDADGFLALDRAWVNEQFSYWGLKYDADWTELLEMGTILWLQPPFE